MKNKHTDPLVVWLMDYLVEERDMQPAVYPIDTVVGEQEEAREFQIKIAQYITQNSQGYAYN